MKKKLALNFKETKDAALYGIATGVTYRMTENNYFPDPGMLIIELGEITTQFLQAMTDASNKDRVKIAIKNSLKALLVKKLKEVGEFVKIESKGDETAMLSSGFPIFTPKEEIILKKPTNFKIQPGRGPGEIIMKINRVNGAKTYLYEWTPTPITRESIWQSIPDTRCKKKITKLPLGKEFAFRMAAIGSHNQLQYTIILTRYIS